MGKTGVLGSFEELVLLALIRQRPTAYSVSIRKEVEARTGSSVAIGAVHATLDRLENKGWIHAREESSEGRPGRPRRYFDLLPAGATVLLQSREIRDSMWDGVDLHDLAHMEPRGS